jgi:hypothetical protein
MPQQVLNSILGSHGLGPAEPSKSDLPLQRKGGGAAKDKKGAKMVAGQSLATTSVHPAVIQVSLAGVIWFLAVTWLYFAWGPHVDLDLAVVTGFFVMFFTLFLQLTSAAIKDPRWFQQRASFRKFLQSKVPTYTGEMRGRDALIEITLVPVSLALAATLIGLVAWMSLH